MKHIFTLFVIAFLFATIFTACKKQTVTNTIYVKDTLVTKTITVKDTVHGGNIIGYWPGTYNSPGNYPASQFSFLFRSDSTVRIYIDGNVGDTASAVSFGEVTEGVYRIINYTVTTQFVVGGNLYSTYGTTDSSFIFYEGTIGQGLQTSGFLVDIAHKQ
ncbi:MAG TPA: hypothetical protein VK559_08475 [Ferruginibacter sp.]|nr:hypothetical protein [Ferruginibacter sp.]